MVVELTSPVLGQAVGTTYTGTLEDWLLASGYAKRAGYTGPGVSRTGATDVLPASDPGVAANREQPYFPGTEDKTANVANTGANLTALKVPHAKFDFDASDTDDEAPSSVTLSPVTGPLAGSTVVTIKGENLERVSSVTFGGTAGTALDVSKAATGTIKVTTPVGTAGAKNVVLVDPSGNATVTNGFTYA